MTVGVSPNDGASMVCEFYVETPRSPVGVFGGELYRNERVSFSMISLVKMRHFPANIARKSVPTYFCSLLREYCLTQTVKAILRQVDF